MKVKEMTQTEWLKLRDKLFVSSGRFMISLNKLTPNIRDKIIKNSGWSPKDVLSHIVGWDTEVVKKFKAFLVDPDVSDHYNINDFNRNSVLKRKNNSWDEIIMEFKNIQEELSKITSQLTQENLKSEPRFKEWVEVLIGHYNHHRVKIEKLFD